MALSGITLVIVLLWLGFLALLGVVLSERLIRHRLRERMERALRPTDEDLEDIEEFQTDEEMSRGVVYRVLSPFLKKMAGRMKGGKPRGGAMQQVREMLEQAGRPLDMGLPEFMALKTFCLLLFGGIGVISSFWGVPFVLQLMLGNSGDAMMRLLFTVLWCLVFAFLGFSGPTFWLRRVVNARIRAIRKSMADVVDLIVLAIEAGLGFDQAMQQAIEKTKGPLTDELRRVAADVNLGKSQGDAFREMVARVKMQELSLLVAAIDQATRMGTGLATALRLQANEIRERRMAAIKEAAGKLPVKMMMPLVLFIFPALFVVILGPALVQVSEMSARGELGAFGG